MLAPRVVTVLLVVLFIVPVTARAAAPRPGVFAGTLGVKVPKGAHARVRAIDAASSVVVAGKDVGRSGAFSLSLPAGAYVVRGVVLPRRGAVVTKSTAVSLRPGQRRTHTKLTARKKARKKRARAAFVTERGNVRLGSVAAGIYPFSYSGPSPSGDLAAWSGGVEALLINDVLEGAGKRCPGHVTLREVGRLKDVLREFELGKSRYADKSTFPERNLIILDVAVRGTVTEGADGAVSLALTITNDRTGAKLGAIDVPLDTANIYAGEETLAGQLSDKLCALSETFEVTLDVNGAGHFATHDASGTMHAVLLARRSGEEWTATGPLQWENVSFTLEDRLHLRGRRRPGGRVVGQDHRRRGPADGRVESQRQRQRDGFGGLPRRPVRPAADPRPAGPRADQHGPAVVPTPLCGRERCRSTGASRTAATGSSTTGRSPSSRSGSPRRAERPRRTSTDRNPRRGGGFVVGRMAHPPL